VRAMSDRIGWDGVVALLDDVRKGERFPEAYALRSHDTLASLDARLHDAAPRIAVAAQSGSVVWTLASGLPATALAVSIDGDDGYHLSFTVTTDALGLFRASFGATAAPGTYTVRAGGAAATFTTTP